MKEAARSAEALKREERPRALGATDPGVKGSTLSVVSGLAQCMCTPFWWSVATPEDAVAQILHNGTICYIDTSSRRIGITANHVYKKYLADKEAHDAEAIECQFGSSTIYPERRVIDASERWDIATFDLPDVFVGASIRNRKSYHHAVRWPPHRAQKSDDVMYGGYPGALREGKGSIAELPFQWVSGRVSEVSDDAITLEPDFEKMQWQGLETNDKPGGWSGGPVFRVDDEPIARLELIGALLHDSTAARVGALFQLLVQDTTAQDFGLPSSAIRLRM